MKTIMASPISTCATKLFLLDLLSFKIPDNQKKKRKLKNDSTNNNINNKSLLFH